MSAEFKREDRYIVFKLSDVERYLTDADRTYLAMMKNEIDAGRDCANKPPFKGLIVESDWPEYEPTWKAIEARVTGAQPAPSIPDTHNDMVVGLDYQGAMSCARQRAKKEAGLLYPEGDARKEEKERELASEYYRQYTTPNPEAKP